jgi:hypothetical protein
MSIMYCFPYRIKVHHFSDEIEQNDVLFKTLQLLDFSATSPGSVLGLSTWPYTTGSMMAMLEEMVYMIMGQVQYLDRAGCRAGVHSGLWREDGEAQCADHLARQPGVQLFSLAAIKVAAGNEENLKISQNAFLMMDLITSWMLVTLQCLKPWEISVKMKMKGGFSSDSEEDLIEGVDYDFLDDEGSSEKIGEDEERGDESHSKDTEYGNDVCPSDVEDVIETDTIVDEDEGKPEIWEDIYGRKRDTAGNIMNYSVAESVDTTGSVEPSK